MKDCEQDIIIKVLYEKNILDDNSLVSTVRNFYHITMVLPELPNGINKLSFYIIKDFDINNIDFLIEKMERYITYTMKMVGIK